MSDVDPDPLPRTRGSPARADRSGASRALGIRCVALFFLLVSALASLHCGRDVDPESAAATSKETGEVELYSLAEQLGWLKQKSRGEAKARLDPALLMIPYGERVEFFLRIPAGSNLSFERIEFRGESEAALEITLQRDGEAEVEVTEIRGNQASPSIPIPSGGSEISRLSLAVHAASGGEGQLVLLQPAITAARGETGAGNQQYAGTSSPGKTKQPDIILYVIDTLRPDHLGAYGYDVPVSPYIDKFAAEATVFEDAVAQAPWTKPSMASIFSGLGPHQHEVKNFKTALSSSVLTLGELLSAAGYYNAGFIANPVVRKAAGFAQGFDIYNEYRLAKSDHVNENVFTFLNTTEKKRPLFLYVHTLDPHYPYDPNEDFRARFAADVKKRNLGSKKVLEKLSGKITDGDPVVKQVLSLYDAEIAFNDRSFGLFLDELKRHGLYESSLIILVGDHGEEFWEHDHWGHDKTLFNEVLNVPLIIKAPFQNEGERAPDLVQHVDIFSTILDYARTEIPAYAGGRSLRNTSAGASHVVSAYAGLDFRQFAGASVIEKDWKLIVARSGKKKQRLKGASVGLYSRRSDPGEHDNLYRERPIVANYMMSLLRAHESEKGLSLEAETETLSEELKASLRALGYIE